MPFYLLLIVYIAAILFGQFFFGVSLYHLTRFGFFDFTARLNTMLLAGVFVIVIVFSIVFLRHVDWTETVELSPDLTIDRLSNAL